MTYRLTKSSESNEIVLVSDYADVGTRYTRNSTLPHTKGKTGNQMTGTEFVLARTRKPGGEPGLGCDDPKKLIQYASIFLTTGFPADMVQIAEWLAEMMNAGHDLPPIEVGRKLSDYHPLDLATV